MSLLRAGVRMQQMTQQPATRQHLRWPQRQLTMAESPARSARAWTAHLPLPGKLRQACLLLNFMGGVTCCKIPMHFN